MILLLLISLSVHHPAVRPEFRQERSDTHAHSSTRQCVQHRPSYPDQPSIAAARSSTSACCQAHQAKSPLHKPEMQGEGKDLDPTGSPPEFMPEKEPAASNSLAILLLLFFVQA